MRLIPEEKEAYKLLFVDRFTAEEAAEKMNSQGLAVTPKDLRKFKKNIQWKLQKEMREEYLVENMLDSYERVRIEFEDSINRIKNYIDTFEKQGNFVEAMNANKDIKDHIMLALKNMGKLADKVASVKADNINILNVGDFSQAFKNILHTWFDQMQVKVEGGKLVFENPSPELLDNYYSWEAKKIKKEITDKIIVDANVIE
jgi:hypothetical protein